MYRLLATDIDDTLLAPDGSLPQANHDALQRLHAAGITIVFCSGRADASIRKIAAPILEPADDEYYIAFNGALTVTARSRDVVSRRFLSAAAAARVLRYAREHGLYVQGYAGDDFVVESDHEYARMYARETKTTLRIVDDIAAALPDGTPKLLFIGDHDELARHQTALAKLPDDRPDERFSLMFSKPHYLEVVARGVDKGDALVRLAETLGIAVEETLAVGDGDNDIAMIRAAGQGVAVADAKQAAREAADVVLESRASEGAIAEIARRFFNL